MPKQIQKKAETNAKHTAGEEDQNKEQENNSVNAESAVARAANRIGWMFFFQQSLLSIMITLTI